MKLIIDIPEEEYRKIWILSKDGIGMALYDWIANGTPLPKGHGRLIDADEIQFENVEFDTYSDYSRAFDAIDYAPTIIEADVAESEDKE